MGHTLEPLLLALSGTHWEFVCTLWRVNGTNRRNRHMIVLKMVEVVPSRVVTNHNCYWYGIANTLIRSNRGDLSSVDAFNNTSSEVIKPSVQNNRLLP